MIDAIQPIRQALISVFDKRGIIEFSRFLSTLGVRILSTSSTAKLLTEQGLVVTDVADYTGFPEIMSGRVKTLHPKVHGGLLGRETVDREVMQGHGIEPIDLLVVNLYPFEKTIMTADYHLCIEQIDIGGPAMIRSAAKNHQRVTVVVHPDDYMVVEREIKESGGISLQLRTTLATKAFQRTADYDATIAAWFLHTQERSAPSDNAQLPDQLQLSAKKALLLRYGENPHQRAAFYQQKPNESAGLLMGINQLQGKDLSFNNVVDAETADRCVHEFSEPACVIVKHATPCGAAYAKNIGLAYQNACSSDMTSAFGGIIAFNRSLDATLARQLVDGVFAEVIIAPNFDPEALPILRKKTSLRVLQGCFLEDPFDYCSIAGGVLVQDKDTVKITRDDLQVQTGRMPDDNQISGLLFAWRVVKYAKSNAIVLATADGTNCCTAGIGAGQTSRIESVRMAIEKAVDQAHKQLLVMASDAFFPFADSIELAAQAGVSAIIQPGGSVRDKEVIAAAERHSIAMVYTGIRHFRH